VLYTIGLCIYKRGEQKRRTKEENKRGEQKRRTKEENKRGEQKRRTKDPCVAYGLV
jgi:hypothetical protein